MQAGLFCELQSILSEDRDFKNNYFNKNNNYYFFDYVISSCRGFPPKLSRYSHTSYCECIYASLYSRSEVISGFRILRKLELITSRIRRSFLCTSLVLQHAFACCGHVWLVSYPSVINLLLVVITMFLSAVCFHQREDTQNQCLI